MPVSASCHTSIWVKSSGHIASERPLGNRNRSGAARGRPGHTAYRRSWSSGPYQGPRTEGHVYDQCRAKAERTMRATEAASYPNGPRQMTDTHDAYVTIGCDELNYVHCDDCRGTIFGPTDNEFEANGVAVDHKRNPPATPLPVPPRAYPARATPTVIPPTRPGSAWSVGQSECPPPSPPPPSTRRSRHLDIVPDERSHS